MLVIISIIVILLFWMYSLFGRKISPLVSLLILTTISFSTISANGLPDFIIKLLYFITTMVYLSHNQFKGKIAAFVVFISLVIFGGSLINAQFGSHYVFIDSLTALATFITGLLLFCLDLNGKEKLELLKGIVYLPLASLLIGIPLALMKLIDYFSRMGTAIAGASLETNLSFFGAIGIMAAIILKNITNNNKYDWLKVINFIIVCATLTRGGILASIIVLIPDILSLIKKSLIKVEYFILTALGILVSIYPVLTLWRGISERSFQNGEVNTSGRLTAWNYIIHLVNNRWWGTGYGSLKTLTYDSRLAAFTAAHNVFVQSYFETGIIGLILLFLILSVIFLFTLKTQIIKRKYTVFMFLSFLTYSFTDNCIVNYKYWFPFMLVLGGLCVSNHSTRQIKIRWKY